MKVETLYAIVIKNKDGGQRMNSFSDKNKAIEEGKKVTSYVIENNVQDCKVYYSELDYDKYNNRLLSNKLINSKSKLLLDNSMTVQ